MKKIIIVKLIAALLTLAIIPSAYLSSFATTQSDDVIYVFEDVLTDTLGSELYIDMYVNHVGSLLTDGNASTYFYAGDTTPVNDYVYLNVSFYVTFRASPNDPAYSEIEVESKYIDLPRPRTGHWAMTDVMDLPADRIVNEITVFSKLSESRATESGLGTTYRSLVTKQYYERMITRGYVGILEHGNDYLNDD